MLLRSLTSSAISTYLEQLCRTQVPINRVYEGLLEPCLRHGSHYTSNPDSSVATIPVRYHDHSSLPMVDYFSAIGYVLAQTTSPETNLVALLSKYAEWCRVSAARLAVNPPTVVQALWVLDDKSKFSLAASVSAGKELGSERVRMERIKTLQDVWNPHQLVNPTPVQLKHAEAAKTIVEPSAELFGTPWGHCGEAVSFASMHRHIKARVPMGTLALGVKAMTSIVPGTDVVPVEAVEALANRNHTSSSTQALFNSDIIEILRVSGALRPMCLNCRWLMQVAKGNIVDYGAELASVGEHVHSHL
ncbi:hypothetical protein C8J56DRAFT_262664 [Mycena floridula]|nr:hypothetical protein C8J56DRAFT_262664 [Mycena floridula]